MSSTIWPYLPDDERIAREEEHLAAELDWLLSALQETLPSLKSGLQECVDLLRPSEPGSTLALSSLRSESVKGFITRIGTRVTKAQISLRLSTLGSGWSNNSPAFPLRIHNPIQLPQLSHLLTLLNTSLDIIDISSWTGDPTNGHFIAGQLKLLSDTLEEARATLKGGEDRAGGRNVMGRRDIGGGKWWDHVPHLAEAVSESAWEALPPTLAPHLTICDAAVVLTIRTLGPPSAQNDAFSLSGLSLRSKLGLGARPQVHDEMDQTFTLNRGNGGSGQAGEEVGVREKVRVESQDPSLMAVMAKLSVLSHEVKAWRLKVAIVMEEEIDI